MKKQKNRGLKESTCSRSVAVPVSWKIVSMGANENTLNTIKQVNFKYTTKTNTIFKMMMRMKDNINAKNTLARTTFFQKVTTLRKTPSAEEWRYIICVIL